VIEVFQYILQDETCPFEEWYNDQNAITLARISRYLARIEEGNFSNSKSVGGSVNEIKIDFGPGYRIYFGKDGGEIVILLIGGTKKRQQNDIAKAKIYWEDYKLRKKENGHGAYKKL